MPARATAQLAWLCIVTVCVAIYPALLQKPPKRRMIYGNAQPKMPGCCEEIKELKLQVANLSRMLQELSKKQEGDWVNVVMQVMELEGSTKQMESRLIDAESKYSEMNNQIDIMQLQAAQTVTQTSAGKEGVTKLPDTLLNAQLMISS